LSFLEEGTSTWVVSLSAFMCSLEESIFGWYKTFSN
jgi:hypothetical protein